jgi:hypothetical protein
VESPAGLTSGKQSPSGGRRNEAGIADQRTTTRPPDRLRTHCSGHQARLRPQAGAGERRGGSAPALKRRRNGTRLRPPTPSVPPAASAAGGQSEPTEGFSRPDTTTACRRGGRSRALGSRASARQKGALGMASPGWGGASATLKEEQSPWKDRVTGRWQRRLVTTDSSAEQSLEVGCSVRFRRAQTPAHFGECGRSVKESRGFGRGPRAVTFGSLNGLLRNDRRALSQRSRRSDCPPRRRRFGTGTSRVISQGDHGSFGPRGR